MVPYPHASQRDEIMRLARELVQEDPVRFEHAGRRLDEIYSEESVRRRDDDTLAPGEKFAVEETPELLRFQRLGRALHCFRYPDQHEYDNHLDFEHNGKVDDRRLAARMAVLVMLAAADPNKDEVVTKSMGVIASIPHEITETVEDKRELAFGGSEWIPWAEDGWDNQAEPSPKHLQRLRHAIDVARHGSSESARVSRIPSGDGRPCNKQGKNRHDECERALRDVGRSVGHFYWCVDYWRREWTYRFEESTRREMDEIRVDNRSWWAKWPGVIVRARESIRAIDLPELAPAKQKAFDALTIIADVYSEPLMYHDDEQPGDHLLRMAHLSRVDEHQVKQRDRLVEALNNLDPLRRGCLLYIDELDLDQAPKPEQMIPWNMRVEGKTKISRGMTVEQARQKAESIARKQGWPVYRDSPSLNGMATRVGCSIHTMKKAKELSSTLQHHYDKAFIRPDTTYERDRDREIRALSHEQRMDEKRRRV